MKLVRRAGPPSIVNTKEDIALILLEEFYGDEQLSKAAIYELAKMHLELHGSGSTPDRLDDVVEYLLLTGSRAHAASSREIGTYLELKTAAMSGKKSERKVAMRQLLKRVALYSEVLEPNNTIDPVALEQEQSDLMRRIVFSISQLYLEEIRGGNEPQGRQTIDTFNFDPPPTAMHAAANLIESFPMLQRMRVSSYADIVAAIEIDTLMQHMPQNYANQIREIVEAQLDTRLDGSGEPMSGIETLWVARTGYLISRGVEPLVPSISKKHFAQEDYLRALQNALSMHDGPRVDMTRVLEQNNLDMLQVYGFYDREAALIQRRRDISYRDEPKTHAEYRQKIKGSLRQLPFRLDQNQSEILLRLLYIVSDDLILPEEDMKALQKLKGLDAIDPICFSFMALVCGLEVGEPYDKGDPLRIRITNYMIGGGREAIDLTGRGIEALTDALLVTTVNNLYLQKIIDASAYPIDHYTKWRNPTDFEGSYHPKDQRVARSLMDRYSVFSFVPVLTPIEIVAGVLLYQLQETVQDYHIDEEASMVQNLLVRCLHAFG